MKKLGFVLLLLALSGVGYYHFFLPPKFSGNYAGVHEGIWKFSHENNLMKKYEIAARLQASKLLRKEETKLSEEEQRIESEAIQWTIEIGNRALEFEAKLTPNDVSIITQANPDSFFRRIKIIRRNNFNEKCPQEEYEAIRKKIGFKDIMMKARFVGPLVMLYEDEFQVSYTQKIIDLLKTDQRFSEYRDLAETHYPATLNLFKSLKDNSESRKTEYEENLVKADVPRTQVKEYALDLAAQSPACLGGIRMDFVRAMHEDETRTRGEFLLEKIKQFVQANGKAPKDIYDIPLDKSDALFGKTYDGWGNAYILSRQDGVLILSSKGQDDHSEMKIGEIQL